MNDAYAAGLVDGEGCIWIPGNRSLARAYSIRVDISQTTKGLEILNRLAAEYGGMVRMTKPEMDQHSAAFTWRAFGRVAANFLLRVQPHLVLKREQCRLAMLLQSAIDSAAKRRNGNAIWNQVLWDTGETIRLRVMDLNRKGPKRKIPISTGCIALRVAGQWVTRQGDLFSETSSEKFSGPWLRSGSMRSGCVYERPMLERHTGERDSSFSRGSAWPTPDAGLFNDSEDLGSWEARREREATRGQNGNGMGTPLAVAVRLWPTATATATDANASGAAAYSTESGRQLNPDWVELLQGFPVGWTRTDGPLRPVGRSTTTSRRASR